MYEMKDNPLKMPREEDVTEVRMGNNRLGIVKITDENRDYLVELTLSMYLGEKCKFCLRLFETLDDLKDAVYAGYHEHGRVACKSCWRRNEKNG